MTPETSMDVARGLQFDDAERLSYLFDLFPFPSLPQPSSRLFARDAIINDLLGLVERFASLSLFGAGGIGKSAIVLTLLHHDQVTAKFGEYRYFVRCDDLVSSLDCFLGRLSDAIGAPHTTGITQLRSHLELSPPCILVLDGVDYILDPLAPEADEIAAVVQEFGRCQAVCLLTTSRMDIEIPDFYHIEVPTLPEDGAQDIFYNCCHLRRSSVVDKLLAELHFHPLSVDLLARAVRENKWDEPALLKGWGGGDTSILKASGRQSLEDNIKSILFTPTIQGLGSIAREIPEAIAVYPRGVEESKLERMFPGRAGVREAVNVLCKFFLVYREDGFLKMLSPFRFYFLESMHTLVFLPRNDTRNPAGGENIRYIRRGAADSGLSFSFHQLYRREVTVRFSIGTRTGHLQGGQLGFTHGNAARLRLCFSSYPSVTL